MNRTLTPTKTVSPLRQPNPDLLREVSVRYPQPKRSCRYFTEGQGADGNLYYQTDHGRYIWVAFGGQWEEATSSLAKATPDPMPEGEGLAQRLGAASPPPAAEMGFSFAFGVVVDGTPGTLTITAPTVRQITGKLNEVKAQAERKGTRIQMAAARPQDEFFILLADGNAFCLRHNEGMTLREKQGDKWWSHNAGTEGEPCYCRGRPGKDSPGWDKQSSFSFLMLNRGFINIFIDPLKYI